MLVTSDAMDQLQEVQMDTEHGFVDIDLPLASVSQNEEGIREILGRGRYGGDTLSLLVRFGPGWDSRQIDLGGVRLSMHGGDVELVSVLGESDAFVRVLDEKYGSKFLPGGMKPRVSFRAVSLAGDPARLQDGRLEMKLFFNSDDETRYAEFYLNIDADEGVVQFHEKDGHYRKAIVMALAKEEPRQV